MIGALKGLGIGLCLALLLAVAVLVDLPVHALQLIDTLWTGRVAYELDDGLLGFRYISQGRNDLIPGFVFSWLVFLASAFLWWHILAWLVSWFGLS